VNVNAVTVRTQLRRSHRRMRIAYGRTCTVKANCSLLCAITRAAQGINTETKRLRTIQKPNLCEQSVDACVRGRKMVPPDAVRLTTLSELTIPLRRQARTNALAESAVWLAWSDADAIWFVTGTISLELSRERGRPVLQMRVYNRDGALDEALTCMNTTANVWERISVH
jgi:hypothetical protein